MLNEDLVKYRLECLKMSYEVTSDIIMMNNYNGSASINITDFIKDVFMLTDINFDYILNGVTPDYKDEDNGVSKSETI